MTASFDVGELHHALGTLLSRPHLRKLALVLPLAPGARDFVEALVSEGPPFDLRRAGLTAHEVFLTDSEAIFVFELAKGPETLERILAEEDFWTVVQAWEHVAAGSPRPAFVAFDWRAGRTSPTPADGA
jgi:hypothetical protein